MLITSFHSVTKQFLYNCDVVIFFLILNQLIGISGLCKMRCFPPVALAWDPISGVHIFPNLYSETIVVDSSPALLSFPQRSERTTVLLLVRNFPKKFVFLYYVILKFSSSNFINLRFSFLHPSVG